MPELAMIERSKLLVKAYFSLKWKLMENGTEITSKAYGNTLEKEFALKTNTT